MVKSERWRQANPRDQFKVILMSFEGHLSNCKDGFIGIEKFLDEGEKHLKEMRELLPFYLKSPDQW